MIRRMDDLKIQSEQHWVSVLAASLYREGFIGKIVKCVAEFWRGCLAIQGGLQHVTRTIKEYKFACLLYMEGFNK